MIGARSRRLAAGLAKPDRIKRLKRRIALEHPLDFNRTFDSLIFVAGTGRSGTTWLVDLLNAENRHRVIFEPLRPNFGALGKGDIPRYIRPDNDDPELVELVRKILLARFKSTRWTGRGNTRVISRSRIIKDVHSNLRLGWLREQFPPFPLFLIIRHPCAVAASRERLQDEVSIQRFLDDPRLLEDHLQPFVDELERLETPVEHEVAWWCIETLVPLRQLEDRSDVLVVFYEHLVADPGAVVEDLYRSLGEAPPRSVYEQFDKPSLTTYRPKDPLPSTAIALDDWQDRLTPAQIHRALEIVALFGLEGLYGPDPEPLVARGRELPAA